MKKINSFLLCLLSLGVWIPKAYAQVDLESKFMLNSTDSVASKFPSITDIVSTILPNILILAGLVMFFIGFAAGVVVISSGGNPEKKEKGTAALKGAIIGFVIIFASYWIIQILEIITGVPILNSGI